MSEPGDRDERDERVLILAPTAKDAEASRQVLAAAGVACEVCPTLPHLCRQATLGAAAAVIPEEVLAGDGVRCLLGMLRDQPAWSDLPLIVLAPLGTEGVVAPELDAVAHMTVVKRPLQLRAFVSTVRAAIRDRRRQYAARDRLAEQERQAAALRQSEERFRTLVTTTTEVVWATDAAGGMAADAASWPAFTGQPPAECAGSGWLAAVHPADRPQLRATWHAALAVKASWEAEYRLRRSDGEYRLMAARGAPVPDSDGGVREWVGTCTDVTEQRRGVAAVKASEARFRFLDALHRATRGAADPAAIMAATTRLLGEHLRASRCAYADVEADGDRFHIRHDWAAAGVPSSVGAYSLALFGPRAAAGQRAGHTLVLRAASEELPAGEGRDTFRAIGVEAIVCCPLVKGGRLAAMMAVHHDRPRDWTPDEVALIEEVVERSWAHVERVRAEAEVARLNGALARRVQELQALFAAAPVGINVATDPGCREIVSNEALAEMIGMAAGDNVSKSRPDADSLPYRVLRDGADVPPADLPMQRAARTGEAVRGELYEFARADGGRVSVLVSAAPVRDDAGAVTGAVGVVADVTSLRRAEEALLEQDRRKDEFLATLAHELRNPLAPIRNGLALLQSPRLAPERAAPVRDMMERQLGHMVRLVDDLLDISRVSRGKVELKKRRVTLRAIVDAAVETCRPMLEAAGHDLRVDLPAEPLALDADPTRLAQVVGNLLNNSAKYTPDGGRVTLSARREGGEAILRVADNGVGIPAEMLPKVFDIFTQVNRNLDRAQGGLGIGLSLVRKLVELHGGTVAAESDGPGRGSAFTVRLPLAASAAAEGPADAPAADANGVAPALRVLVVDDNEDGAESLALLLGVLGHETELAYTGPDALAAALTARPDVVLLDIGLPGMSGYEVARRIRREPGMRATALVALTGWGSEEDRAEAREAGFDHHLTKPVNAEELAGVLAGLKRAGVSGRGLSE